MANAPNDIFYGALDGLAVCYTSAEAWIYGSKGWQAINAIDPWVNALTMSKAEFTKAFPKLPALPAAAFRDQAL